MSYTVKQVASMAGVSVRTLHHYHHIGLLRPHTVTEAGYRLYGQEELERLQQILFHRELGFALADIKTILDRPDFDRLRALESHRAALVARRKRLATLIRTVERSVASIKGETIMEGHRLYDGFDVEAVLAQQQGYAAEVDERYDPATVEESRRRTSRYTRAEWGRILKEGEELRRAMGEQLSAGAKAEDRKMQELVRQHHLYINDRFYTCSMEMYRGLGELYVDDERFAKNFDRIRPGLARFVRDAIRIYAGRA